jgi:hypothetical protein
MFQRLSSKERERRKKLVEEWQLSGLNIITWCRRANVNYKQFLYWKAQIKAVDSGAFVELKEDNKTGYIILSYKDITIQLCKGFDREMLLRCLEVIKQC